eukprot:7320991-Prymnesium_polylepis.1
MEEHRRALYPRVVRVAVVIDVSTIHEVGCVKQLRHLRLSTHAQLFRRQPLPCSLQIPTNLTQAQSDALSGERISSSNEASGNCG